MKFTLPVVCLALSIPTAVVAAASSGRLHGGGVGSIQAEKATAAEAAMAKAVRSLETKVRCLVCMYLLVCVYVKKSLVSFGFLSCSCALFCNGGFTGWP